MPRLRGFRGLGGSATQPAVQDFEGNAIAAEGEAVFMRNACINCHAVSAQWPRGASGPILPTWQAATPLPPERFRTMRESSQMDRRSQLNEAGALMPAMHLNDHDLDVITAYLTQLR